MGAVNAMQKKGNMLVGDLCHLEALLFCASQLRSPFYVICFFDPAQCHSLTFFPICLAYQMILEYIIYDLYLWDNHIFIFPVRIVPKMKSIRRM